MKMSDEMKRGVEQVARLWPKNNDGVVEIPYVIDSVCKFLFCIFHSRDPAGTQRSQDVVTRSL